MIEQKPFRWSFSMYDAYQTCPKKLYETRIAKNFPEPETEHMKWGTAVHEALELAVRDGKDLPDNMHYLKGVCTVLQKTRGQILTEHKLAVSRDLDAVPFDSELGWCRGIVDYLALNGEIAVALDYKTGKRKLTKQLELMALLIFANFTRINKIWTGFVWLKDQARVDNELFERKNMPDLWASFRKTVDEMEYSYETDIWPKVPNGLCKNWCPVETCPFNGKRR